ncbi:MAG TPA: hypothetical protein DIC53_08205 [Synergistaceae bacterium]|nr:hypothetical protein [Synergistaceae bacterium]
MSNLGLAYRTNFTVEAELRNGTVKRVDTKIKNGAITAIYTYHKNKRMSASMELFIDPLKKEMALSMYNGRSE